MLSAPLPARSSLLPPLPGGRRGSSLPSLPPRPGGCGARRGRRPGPGAVLPPVLKAPGLREVRGRAASAGPHPRDLSPPFPPSHLSRSEPPARRSSWRSYRGPWHGARRASGGLGGSAEAPGSVLREAEAEAEARQRCSPLARPAEPEAGTDSEEQPSRRRLGGARRTPRGSRGSPAPSRALAAASRRLRRAPLRIALLQPPRRPAGARSLPCQPASSRWRQEERRTGFCLLSSSAPSPFAVGFPLADARALFDPES